MPDPTILSKDPTVQSVWVTCTDATDIGTFTVCMRTRAYNGYDPVDVVACQPAGSENLATDFLSVTMTGAIGDAYAALLLAPSEDWALNLIQGDTDPVNPVDDPLYFSP